MAKSRIVTDDDFENIRYQAVGDTTYATADSEYSSGVVVLANRFVESKSWVEVWELVWSENDGKDLFSYYYEEPATEYQEGSEAEFDPEMIRDVIAEEVTIIQYTRVPKKKTSKKKSKKKNQEYDLVEATSEVFRAYLENLE